MLSRLILASFFVSFSIFANSYTFGVGLGNYSYREPDVDVSLGGANTHIFGSYGWDLGDDRNSIYFEYALAFGKFKYQGSGTSTDEPNQIHDIRSYWFRTLNPGSNHGYYFGLGFRYLYNDGRGVSSTGLYGYRRVNEIFYIPAGWTSQFKLSDEWSMAINAEIGLMILGQQLSYLGDADPNQYHTIRNNQSAGINFRLKIPFYYWHLGAGPFLDYWDVPQSDVREVNPITNKGLGEPRNTTTEVGLFVEYLF